MLSECNGQRKLTPAAQERLDVCYHWGPAPRAVFGQCQPDLKVNNEKHGR